MKEAIVGIDLGTTNSEIAVYDNDEVRIIQVDDYDIMPSYVGLSPEDELLIGVTARNQYILYPQRTVKSVKRKMGGAEKIPLGDEEYSPQEISAMLIRRLREETEKKLGMKIKKAIITAPARFSDAQRQATKEAGDIAGLEVLRIINEPTAAALAYEMDHKEGQYILIYDLGGGTFDVSIARIQDGVIEVLSSHGDNQLGGDDFDRKIVDWFLEEFKQENGLDISKDRIAMNRLMHAAEDAKKKLSDKPFVNVREDNLAQKNGTPVHFNKELSRSRFESMIQPDIHKTMDAVHKALDGAGLSPSDINQVLLVGGSTRIPYITDRLKEMTGIVPRRDIHPDLCVALGAGVLAAREMGVDEQKILVDVTPYTFGIKTIYYRPNGLPVFDHFSSLIYKNTPLPTSHTEVFETTYDNQETVNIEIYQGDGNKISENYFVGSFLVKGLAPVPEGNEILVRMDLDFDGILHVSATEKKTGLSKKIVIRGAFNQMDESERKQSRSKLDQLFQDENEDVSIDKQISEHPSYKSSKHEENRGTIESALALAEKAERLEQEMHPDDQAETRALNQTIREAVKNNDIEKLEEAVESLADLLFFIDEV